MGKMDKVAGAICDADTASDGDAESTSRRRDSSFATVVASLDVGHTAARAMRLHPSTPLGDLELEGARWKEALRNNTAPAVKRAREQTGGEYEVEVTEAMTTKRRIYIVALVTRTA